MKPGEQKLAAAAAVRQPLKPGSELRRSLSMRRNELIPPDCCGWLALARPATDISSCATL